MVSGRGISLWPECGPPRAAAEVSCDGTDNSDGNSRAEPVKQSPGLTGLSQPHFQAMNPNQAKKAPAFRGTATCHKRLYAEGGRTTVLVLSQKN